eukprot:m.213437 g.213437  ORF g.213437 m.213437 type:complete len:643 (+) comp16955_c0_seq1:187-2115(+)
MRRSTNSAAILFAAVALALIAAVAGQVWPPPRSMRLSSKLTPVAETLQFISSTQSDRLDRAIQRTLQVLPRAGKGLTHQVEIHIRSSDETLNGATSQEYSIMFQETTRHIFAETVYGAMYALETLTQLAATYDGHLPEAIMISDAPAYGWRGLMIDSGRRFFPMDLVQNLLDTMAAVKLNVLHLHASDFCRFGVESNKFPNLTQALTGLQAGFYSQSDIADMISYAKDRGIRVVPEFDVPGHSRGMLPIEGDVVFCTNGTAQSQLYNDPQGRTLSTLKTLMTEMSGLFEDEVFNIGSDETSAKGVCDTNSTFTLERTLLEFINQTLHKTPEGWEEVYFDNGAATNATIIDAWSHYSPGQITATGRRAIESASSHFYFTTPAPGGPQGWSNCWYDISQGVPSSQMSLLLGGEMSMWSDNYCYIAQCGAFGSSNVPAGAVLYDPAHDAEFSQSIGGMIWPRGFVGAAAFWNFNSSVDPTSAEFVSSIWALNDQLSQRGSYTCPTNCSCDYLTACGKPYLPQVPSIHSSVQVAVCESKMSPLQSFHFNSTTKQVHSRYNTSLCLHASDDNKLLRLETCATAAKVDIDETGRLAFPTTSSCMDVVAKSKPVHQPCTQLTESWIFHQDTGLVQLRSDPTLCLALSAA